MGEREREKREGEEGASCKVRPVRYGNGDGNGLAQVGLARASRLKVPNVKSLSGLLRSSRVFYSVLSSSASSPNFELAPQVLNSTRGDAAALVRRPQPQHRRAKTADPIAGGVYQYSFISSSTLTESLEEMIAVPLCYG